MNGALANDPAGLGWQRRERYRPSLPGAVSGIVRFPTKNKKIYIYVDVPLMLCGKALQKGLSAAGGKFQV